MPPGKVNRMHAHVRPRHALRRSAAVILLTACALVPTVAQPITGPIPPEPSDEALADALLVAPTQGRPVFVEPGGVFRTVAQFSLAPTHVRFELVSLHAPFHRHELISQSPDNGAPDAGVYDLHVPPETPEETYDLEISTPQGMLLGRHAVAVRRLSNQVRLVHLSDMNIGAMGAEGFDDRLSTEVNLLAPTLIVTTGDYLDATHPDPLAGWQALADFLARFDAPVLAACGDHDDVTLFSQTLAPSPVGAIDVGPYRGVVLYDLPRRPISLNDNQCRWIEQELGGSGPSLRFILSHDPRPNLLHVWQEQGTLVKMIRGGRVGLWFTSGHLDWDGDSHRAIVDAAAPMRYLQTHEASSATGGGAEGVSHFRVIDLDRTRAYCYPPPGADGLVPSIPVGRLHLTFDGPNDGSARQVTMTASSGLPFRLDALGARVLLARKDSTPPWCRGARLERLVELPGMWECWLSFDLPDKGSVRAVVGTGQPPPPLTVEANFVMPDKVVLQRVADPDGSVYLTAGRWLGAIQVQNVGSAPIVVTPLVRLDGSLIPYGVVEEHGPVATAYRLRLAPDQVLTLQLDLTGATVAEGRRELQVYLDGGVARVPVCTPLDVTVLR